MFATGVAGSAMAEIDSSLHPSSLDRAARAEGQPRQDGPVVVRSAKGLLSVLSDVALDGGDQPDIAARAPSLAAEVGVLADRVVDDGDVVR